MRISRNKPQIFNAILLGFLLIAGIIVYFLYSQNNNLLHQLERRDNLTSNIKIRDSIYAQKTKKYSEIINQYVSNCKFSVGKKSISAAELVRFVNQTLDTNRILIDSLKYLHDNVNLTSKYEALYRSMYKYTNDSFAIFKAITESAKKRYGIEYRITKSTGGTDIEFIYSKADSALMLFPHFKDRVKPDPNDKNKFIIRQCADDILKTKERKDKKK